jgi:CheY-like chemotaxis protein
MSHDVIPSGDPGFNPGLAATHATAVHQRDSPTVALATEIASIKGPAVTVEKIEDLRILAVDDERVTLATIERLLGKLGIGNVVTMGSAADALKFIGENGGAIDVILLDMVMPGIDGVDLIVGLKACGYQGRIAVVSGGDERMLAGTELLARSKDIEILGTLKKPVSAAGLKVLLGKAVSPAG